MNKVYTLKDNDLVLGFDKKYVLRIKDLDDADKPREKLIRHGSDFLSVSELLAVVFNVGTKKENVLEMTQRILREYGEKAIVSEKRPASLAKELEIPLNKACQVVACFELGRRYFSEKDGKAVFVRTAKQAFNYLSDMQNLPKECFRGLYLNSRYQIIHDEVISMGSLTSNIVHAREVFRPAVECSAAAIIVAHNHPSGSLKPTQSDIEVTEKLVKAGEVLGIDILDHLVIAKNKFMSILEDKDYENEKL